MAVTGGALGEALAGALPAAEYLPAVADLVARPAPVVVYVGGPPPRGRAHRPDLAHAEGVFGRALGPPVGRVVLISSTATHEPNHHHPGLAGVVLAPPRFGNPVARAWRRLEELARAAADGCGLPLAILRVPVVWPGAGGFFGRLFAGRRVVVPAGRDPMLQVLALGDLARAVEAVVARGWTGVAQLAPPAAIGLRGALARAGVRRLALPAALQRPARRLLTRRGGAAPPAELDYLRFPWTVDGEPARRALGLGDLASSAAALAGGGRAPASRRDDFGLDEAFLDRVGRTVFRFLRQVWLRLEIEGLERVPRRGPVVLAGVHRGFVPLDAMLVVDGCRRELGRTPRFLVHPGLLRFAFIADWIARMGGVPANVDSGERILAAGGVLAVFPEGVAGGFALRADADRVLPFVNDAFARLAIRHRAPIVPFRTDGPARSFPIFARVDSRRWRRWTEWPFLPVALPFPLPVKWRTRYLEPVHPPANVAPADEHRTARALAAEVRRRLTR